MFVAAPHGGRRSRRTGERLVKQWKWVALLASGATLLQLQACLVDAGYYVMELILTDYLPDLLDDLVGTASSSTG
jgi:hypothetical protein